MWQIERQMKKKRTYVQRVSQLYIIVLIIYITRRIHCTLHTLSEVATLEEAGKLNLLNKVFCKTLFSRIRSTYSVSDGYTTNENWHDPRQFKLSTAVAGHSAFWQMRGMTLLAPSLHTSTHDVQHGHRDERTQNLIIRERNIFSKMAALLQLICSWFSLEHFAYKYV